MKSGIILYDKKIGVTSFQSLGAIKRALGTKKIGHTGTLDSFASGLLVVCVGALTRLASHITAFDKEYDAEITFGAETDTLELTGSVVRNAPLPTEAALKKAVSQFTGVIDQVPPQFSAIHVDGKRASAMMRSGQTVELPARRVTVYSAEVLDVKLAGESANVSDGTAASGCTGDAAAGVSDGTAAGGCTGKGTATGENSSVSESSCASHGDSLVQSAHIHFSVSKGTYIRSLARDIANACGSAAHLTALRRTRVGLFDVNDATDEDGDISASLMPMTSELAAACGFGVAVLQDKYIADFQNGRQLHKNYFASIKHAMNNSGSPCECQKLAVFTENENDFLGIVEQHEPTGKFSYGFVIPKNK